MLTKTLSLEFVGYRIHSPTAWFVPGTNIERSLNELIDSGVPLRSIGIYLAPSSRSNVACCGVFAVFPPQTSIRSSPRWQPYAQAADRFYIPVDSQIQPPIRDDELRALLSNDVSTYMFHPGVGLVAFEKGTELTLSTLINLPAENVSNWSKAVGGVTTANRLLSIVTEESLQIEEIMESLRGTIATKHPDLKSLPKATTEIGSHSFGRLAGAFASFVAQMILHLTKWVPRNAPSPTWINHLESWATSKLIRYSEVIHTLRHREIARLLNLLDTDPDEGLKFALPLAGDPGRGTAIPNNRLIARTLRLSLDGHGGPVDHWNIDFRFRGMLTQRYQKLANREIQLGRYQRAAYILSELLGEHASAASALERGGHYREAAVLHQKKVGNSREAARCLARGGLMEDAIKIYSDLREWEEVGELRFRLGNHEEASLAFERAAQHQQEQRNYIAAAHILENRLHDPDRAIGCLEQFSVEKAFRSDCFRELFATLARHSLHDRAILKIKSLRQQKVDEAEAAILASEFAKLALGYPHRDVSSEASRQTRLLCAERLASGSKEYRNAFVGAIQQLVPDDVLLRRDCRRYIADAARRDRKSSAISVPRGNDSSCQLITKHQVSADIEWKSALSMGAYCIVAGIKDDKIQLNRVSWNPFHIDKPINNTLGLNVTLVSEAMDILLAPNMSLEGSCFLHVPWCLQHIGTVEFAAASSREACRVVSDPMVSPTNCVALTSDRAGHLQTLTWKDQILTLSFLTEHAQLLSSHAIAETSFSEDFGIPKFSLLSISYRTFAAFNDELLIRKQNGEITSITLGGTITGLHKSPRFSRRRVLALIDHGATLIWDDQEVPRIENVSMDLQQPVGTITKNGTMILASMDECRIYRTDGRSVKLMSTFAGRTSQPIAVMDTNMTGVFAILDSSGTLSVFREGKRPS